MRDVGQPRTSRLLVDLALVLIHGVLVIVACFLVIVSAFPDWNQGAQIALAGLVGTAFEKEWGPDL